MKRSTAREIAVQIVFSADGDSAALRSAAEDFFTEEHYSTLAEIDELYSEFPDKKQMEYITRVITTVADNLEDIDAAIEKYSTGGKISRISKTALAVLRCAVCEISYMDDIPDSAAINEAVELDKGYDEPETVSFVNAVLGAFVRAEKSPFTEASDK